MSLPFGCTQWRLGELQPNSLTFTPARVWPNEPNQGQTKGLTESVGRGSCGEETFDESDLCLFKTKCFYYIFRKCPWPLFRVDCLPTDFVLDCCMTTPYRRYTGGECGHLKSGWYSN